jgi:nucleoside-diphosphate-sugar epimerase
VAVGKENTKLEPNSPYGVTKLAAENLVQSFSSAFGIKASVLRLFSVYGPDQRPDMAFFNIINKLKQEQEITIFGNGTQSRSNTYVLDVADAITKCVDREPIGVFNVCGDEEVSILEFVNLASNLIGVQPNIIFGSERDGDQQRTHGDNSRIKSELGWKPVTSFLTGITNQVQAQLSNARV